MFITERGWFIVLDVLIRSYNTVDTVLYPLNAGRRDAARRSRKTWGCLIYFFFPEYMHSMGGNIWWNYGFYY